MHIERLDPRLMMAIGLAPTFADDGTLPAEGLPGGEIGTTLSAERGQYVEHTATRGERFIIKYDADGQPDTQWGEDGSIAIDFDVTKLAYETATGYLYAAGTEMRADGSRASLAVMRITAGGVPDFRFGDTFEARGTRVYSVIAPKADPTKNTTFAANLSVEQWVSLDGRQVMVGFTQAITANRDSVIEVSRQTEGSINLMRLRYNGLRDNTFGRRGSVPVLSTSSSNTVSEFSSNGEVDTTSLTDIDVQADGGYRVIATRRYGEVSGSNSGNAPERATAAFQVKSRLISRSGASDAAQAFSWNLLNPVAGQASRISTHSWPSPAAART